MTDALHSAEDRLRAIADTQPPFAHLLDARIVTATRDKVTAELLVREELTNRNGGLHGGAVMAVADNLGGTAAFLNLPEGRHHDDREQDQFLRRGRARRHDCGGMHAPSPRPHHHGVANSDHALRRQACRDRDPDPARHREGSRRPEGVTGP